METQAFGETFTVRLDAVHGKLADHSTPSAIQLDDEDLTEEMLKRLTRASGIETRYAILDVVGRGGMGTVYQVFDNDLRRMLAMKVMRGKQSGSDESGTLKLDARSLGRFLEEAQVTSQLHHPGVVPVHELGVDGKGQVYFTMRLVRGRDLKEVFRLAEEGKESWTRTRVLATLLKACQTMAFAHEKGVVHRDLKPANVMVGRFGEVYVMDWGLARILGKPDRRDIRIRDEDSMTSEVQTHRRDASDSDTSSPLLTVDGAILGTPSYMSPEQAAGRIEEVGTRSDVYSTGAMLYELLAGRAPYQPAQGRTSPRDALVRTLAGPPEPIGSLAVDTPPELISITEKAMARDPGERYANMGELAEDLGAFLENRVVRAHRTGAVIELRKWVQRNRGLAMTITLTVLTAIGGLAANVINQASANRSLEAKNSELSAERARVLQLADIKTLDDLRSEAASLWPATPSRAGLFSDWIDRATALTQRSELHEVSLESIRSAGDLSADGSMSFPSAQMRWEHGAIAGLLADLREFAAADGGLMLEVRVGLEFALSVEERTTDSPPARLRWESAIASISNSNLCPKYGGLSIRPQIGLTPLGRDPASGLWEFTHVQSGSVGQFNADTGGLSPRTEDGIVLVLIPGGSFWMGSQNSDPAKQNYDPLSDTDEGPVHRVTLDPFFVSKYEVNQAQWMRITGSNPSQLRAGFAFKGNRFDASHPVERVKWRDCTTLAKRLGLQLPTEAQWEYFARAGTDSMFWTGTEKESIRGAANVADLYYGEHGGTTGWPYDLWLDDGYTFSAPVWSGTANPFGLHGIIGNVWEWCRDYKESYDLPLSRGDGYRQDQRRFDRAVRGGCFHFPYGLARSANRFQSAETDQYWIMGLRPVRPLDR